MKKNGSSSGRGNWQSKFPVHNPRGVFATGNTRQAIFFNEFFLRKSTENEGFLRIIGEVFKWMGEETWEMFLGNGRNSFSEFYFWDGGLLFCLNSG
jgi:hypothetical protein